MKPGVYTTHVDKTYIKIPKNYLMSRDEFINHFHDYIKSNNLKITSGFEYPNSMCHIDINIRNLFSISDSFILTYEEFNKQIYKLFYEKN